MPCGRNAAKVKERILMRRYLAIGLVLVVLLLSGCVNPEKDIVGTWVHTSMTAGATFETTYVFHEDGTGTITNMFSVKFTYTITGDQIEITTTTPVATNTETYTFAFKKDQLTLTGAKDVIVLVKQ